MDIYIYIKCCTYRHQPLSTPGQAVSQATGLFVHSLSSLLLVFLVHSYGSDALCHGTGYPGGCTCYTPWMTNRNSVVYKVYTFIRILT